MISVGNRKPSLHLRRSQLRSDHSNLQHDTKGRLTTYCFQITKNSSIKLLYMLLQLGTNVYFHYAVFITGRQERMTLRRNDLSQCLLIVGARCTCDLSTHHLLYQHTSLLMQKPTFLCKYINILWYTQTPSSTMSESTYEIQTACTDVQMVTFSPYNGMWILFWCAQRWEFDVLVDSFSVLLILWKLMLDALASIFTVFFDYRETRKTDTKQALLELV